MWGKAQKHS
ncbi:Uncharacterized protein XB16_2486 [Leptospira santarosai]|uniref:Uncharacterized protein n=1 Tax=Leptospira santarosai TaxID=28183 RepID=A0A2P1QV66_9LEPT|nr:Uncharacterized protein XB16_2486 [Leptospira santarosai]